MDFAATRKGLKREKAELDTENPFRSHIFFLLRCVASLSPSLSQVDRNSVEYSNMMMGLKREIYLLTLFFLCVLRPSSRSIWGGKCVEYWQHRSIFAQFPHYLNVHFCAIFYTLVFGFPIPLPLFFCCAESHFTENGGKKNRKIYRIVSCVTEWNCCVNKWDEKRLT